MTTPKKRTKKRVGLVLLSVLALAGTGTVAWGHGGPGATIPGPDGRIHACFSNSTPRTLRIMQPTESCTASQSGFDFPSTGVLTQLSESAPVGVALGAAVGAMSTGVISCGPKQAINALFEPDLTKPVVLVGVSRGAGGTELTVGLYNVTAVAQTVQVRALCAESFQQ